MASLRYFAGNAGKTPPIKFENVILINYQMKMNENNKFKYIESNFLLFLHVGVITPKSLRIMQEIF